MVLCFFSGITNSLDFYDSHECFKKGRGNQKYGQKRGKERKKRQSNQIKSVSLMSQIGTPQDKI
jgi:hypothetical protein